ncbi:MAG: saccharopine dehydrogenase NADP-binding domain-containing protein [Brumimicrobium sp.]
MRLKKILIIGGYGKVGSIITQHLAECFPDKIVVAGRNLEKAQQLAEILNYKITPYQFDISNPTNPKILSEIGLVIMCIDQENTDFISLCIDKKIHYVDITANQKFVEKAEILHSKAKQNSTTIALSIGLAPGITNLLAQHCIEQLPSSKFIDIFILLGLGEKHGEAAYRWTFDNIHTTYKLSNELKTVKSFTLGKKTQLVGTRKFYSLNFSDQHIMGKTKNIHQVITRVAFDSKLLTRCIALLRKIGLTKIFRNKKIQSILITLSSKLNFGSDIFAVKVISENTRKQKYECSLQGKNEGRITAFVAVEVVRYLMNSNNSHGVQHLHHFINEIPEFLHGLKQYDNSLEIKL